MSRAERLSAIVLSAWAGGLWTVCGIVVPGLFYLIPDTRQAGNVATQFFYAQVALGTLFGLMYWGLRRQLMNSIERRYWFAAVAAPLVFFLVLRPVMNAARAEGNMARFGQLHGVATLLFLIACVSVGVLVWRSAARRQL
ncbi:MAG: DUF4149 domain-containing protein [Steroidobacteraceae bacterium]